MAARREIRFALDDHELATRDAEAGMYAAAHREQRQEAEQHEVDQRHDEPLGEAERDLQR